MSEFTEEKRRRKEAVRNLRRAEKALDTSVERVERRIFRLLQFKEIITKQNVASLIPLNNEVVQNMEAYQKALADVLVIVST